MKQIDFKKDILPHLIAVLVFIILTFIYFKPAVLENKEIKQHDIIEYRGSAQEIIEYREKYKEEPLWTNSMFGGMPAFLISTIHYGEIIQKVANTLVGAFPHPAGMVLIHLVCFYILLLSYGVKPLYAAIGALAFAFTSYTFISIMAGHNNKIKAMGYAPLVMAGVILVFKNRFFIGLIVASIGVALHVGSNHYQITYYLFFILFILGIVEFVFAVKEKLLPAFFKKVAILILAAGLGLAANFGSFYTTYEYSKYTMRGGSELTPKQGATVTKEGGLDKDYAFNWSYGIFESFSLIIPNVEGGSTQGALTTKSNYYKTLIGMGYPEAQAEENLKGVPLYWGDQPITAGPTYFGATICFLFVLGLLVLDNKTRIWLLSATIISIVFAWGKNFPALNYFIFDHLPGYNKFRSVTFILIIAQTCVPLGALLGLYKVVESKFSKELFKKVIIAFGITGGLCLLFALFAGMASFSSPIDQKYFGQVPQLLDALKRDREGLLRSDAFRSFFLILLVAGLIWAALKEKLSRTVAVSIIGILIVIDLWSVDKRYLNDDNFDRRVTQSTFEKTEADEYILSDKSLDYRVINVPKLWDDASTSYYHKSVTGYSGAKMQRYNDIRENILTDEVSQWIQKVQKGTVDFSNLTALNMLNTKYFIVGPSQREVILNDKALGNAWFVSEIKKVKSADEEIKSLKSIDPKTTAVIDESKFSLAKVSYSQDSSSTIHLISYKPNNLIYESTNASDGFGAFSEIYYPKGWGAFIDGKEANIIAVNYILRGLEIPAGKHKIEFKFEPQSYIVGNNIAMVSSIFLLLCIAAAVAYSIKTRKDNILQPQS